MTAVKLPPELQRVFEEGKKRVRRGGVECHHCGKPVRAEYGRVALGTYEKWALLLLDDGTWTPVHDACYDAARDVSPG